MCHSFLRFGTCPNRETCNYAHNTTELQKKLELRKTSLCKYWLRGKCENEDCNFAHGEHELQSTVGVFKTTICKYWKQGCCYSGEFCRHAHGDADLRPEKYGSCQFASIRRMLIKSNDARQSVCLGF